MNCTVTALVCCVAGLAVGIIVTIAVAVLWPSDKPRDYKDK